MRRAPNIIRAPSRWDESGRGPLPAGLFDGDRYHARQDACAWKDRIIEACVRGYCDDLAFRQAQRDCLAFGPLEDRWR